MCSDICLLYKVKTSARDKEVTIKADLNLMHRLILAYEAGREFELTRVCNMNLCQCQLHWQNSMEILEVETNPILVHCLHTDAHNVLVSARDTDVLGLLVAHFS